MRLQQALQSQGRRQLAGIRIFPDHAHVEADQYFQRHGRYEFDGSKLKQAHEWCQLRVQKYMEDNDDIVVSNTFSQKWEMQPYLELAHRFGYYVVVMTVNNVHGTKNVHDVPESSINRMRDRWEHML